MPVLDPRPLHARSPATLADQVFEWLTLEIVSGSLRPGQWVSENEVAARLGVSRSPVREALRSFEQDGLVEVRQRRGTIMADFDAVDADNIYIARQLVEPEMARLAIERMTDDGIEQMAVIVREMQTAMDDRPEFYRAVVRLWQLLLDNCPNRAIRDIVAMLYRRSIRFRGLALRHPQWTGQKIALRFAEQLLKEARAHNADGAALAMFGCHSEMRQLFREQLFVEFGEVEQFAPAMASTRDS